MASDEQRWLERLQPLIHLFVTSPTEIDLSSTVAGDLLVDVNMMLTQINANGTPINKVIAELNELETNTINKILKGEYSYLEEILERESIRQTGNGMLHRRLKPTHASDPPLK